MLRAGNAAPLLVATLAFGCGDGRSPADAGGDVPDAAGDAAADADGGVFVATRRVVVTLDGEPAPDVLVMQGGSPRQYRTGTDGTVMVEIDPDVPGRELVVLASHPDARTGYAVAESGGDDLVIELSRFDRSDNEEYLFKHPGSPDERQNTSFCGHCHVTLDDQWFASPHRAAAENPVVQDVYAGTVGAIVNEAGCAATGGRFLEGIEPGTRVAAMRCYLGDGTLPDLNPECGTDRACDGIATRTGGCADCHAPGIDGVLGGRDLLEAEGDAYRFGVHCDVCHHVESIDLDAPPGVGGRLGMIRPSEPSPTPTLGTFLPLLFGPYPDVANRLMGAVQRDFFREARFCAGCHQLEQAVLVPGEAADLARFPDGRLPIHTTFAEWEAGPLGATTTCRDCHMPEAPELLNAADLQMFMSSEGIAGGWRRPPGSVRAHSWVGPRSEDRTFLRSAAGLVLSTEVAAGTLTVRVTVRNARAPHAIPTGEPMRSLVVRVEARCGDEALIATGGDAIPDFGGYLGRQDATSDWSRWPGAEVGQVVRVVRRTGAFHEYVGFGPFGGRFDAEQRGMPVELVAGSSTITAVVGDMVTFDRPLPAGDVAYLGVAGPLPADRDPALPVAGAPGFAFARVLTGPDGRRMVPHHLAVDVASDNRILAGDGWTSVHEFATTCAAPVVRAVLTHRAYPYDLARQRRWPLVESVVVEATR